VDDRVNDAEQRADEERRIAGDLVARIAAGDRTAEDALVRRYRAGLVFVLSRHLRDPSGAEDLAQEALTIVLLRLRERGLEDPVRLAGFLHRTATNLVRNEVRKAVRRRTDLDELIELAPDSVAGPQGLLAREQTRDLARRLLDELDNPRDREILHRYYVLDEDKAAICDDLALSSLHFNRVLYRARCRFRELLEGRLPPDELASFGAEP